MKCAICSAATKFNNDHVIQNLIVIGLQTCHFGTETDGFTDSTAAP